MNSRTKRPLHRRSKPLATALALAGIALAPCLSLETADAEDRLRLEPGQRIIIAGNTFAKRMDLYGYFETALYCAYPDHNLTVRNLGWAGDEVDLMPRADNTGTFEENLGWHKADVLILCFGWNESFAGEEGLPQWRARLTKFVAGLKGGRFNGKSAPKLVLVSPVSQEDLGAPLPTGKAVTERNAVLESYTRVMAEVAAQQSVVFADLFAPTKRLMKSTGGRKLTVNGVHLNELGYYHASRALAEALGLVAGNAATDAADVSAANTEKLRRSVHEKNYLYHLCWRPLNPYYIWGGRAWCWAADAPMEELEQIGAVVRQRDEAIWSTSKPDISAVWGRQPTLPEIWETPVRCEAPDMPEKGRAPRMEEVRRNGARPKP